MTAAEGGRKRGAKSPGRLLGRAAGRFHGTTVLALVSSKIRETIEGPTARVVCARMLSPKKHAGLNGHGFGPFALRIVPNWVSIESCIWAFWRRARRFVSYAFDRRAVL
jgi:hypothetical protein